MKSRPDLFNPKQHPLSGELLEILDMGEGEPPQCGFLAGFLFFFRPVMARSSSRAGRVTEAAAAGAGEGGDPRGPAGGGLRGLLGPSPGGLGTRGPGEWGYLGISAAPLLGVFWGLRPFRRAKPTASAGWTPDFSAFGVNHGLARVSFYLCRRLLRSLEIRTSMFLGWLLPFGGEPQRRKQLLVSSLCLVKPCGRPSRAGACIEATGETKQSYSVQLGIPPGLM